MEILKLNKKRLKCSKIFGFSTICTHKYISILQGWATSPKHSLNLLKKTYFCTELLNKNVFCDRPKTYIILY